MRKITFGILAHVDSGKTTLSEELLYLSGKIRQKGRVDTKNAYLDTNSIEKDATKVNIIVNHGFSFFK